MQLSKKATKEETLFFLLLEILICSLIGFSGNMHWFFDLFSHFRPLAVVASFILLFPAIFLRHKNSILLALFIIFINVFVMIKILNQTGGVIQLEDKENALSIISFNVLTSNQNYQGVIDMVAEEKPDILVLTETDFLWLDSIKIIEKDYPYSTKHAKNDNFGMAVYAKKPFDEEIKNIGGYQLPLIISDFKEFRLIAAHPVPPIYKENAHANNLYLKEIARIAINEKKPLIVAGDLNSTLWSHSIKPFFSAGLKRINGFGLAYTWPTWFFPFAIQIDHFFGKNIKSANFKVLKNIGSDHYPIKLEFNF